MHHWILWAHSDAHPVGARVGHRKGPVWGRAHWVSPCRGGATLRSPRRCAVQQPDLPRLVPCRSSPTRTPSTEPGPKGCGILLRISQQMSSNLDINIIIYSNGHTSTYIVIYIYIFFSVHAFIKCNYHVTIIVGWYLQSEQMLIPLWFLVGCSLLYLPFKDGTLHHVACLVSWQFVSITLHV